MTRLGLAWLDLVFPRTCAGCGGAVGEEGGHVCWECLAGAWPVQFPMCSACGDPVAGCIGHEYLCATCSRRKRFFDKARSAVHHDGRMADVIRAFKYEKASHLSSDLARLLAACVRAHFTSTEIDAVTCVPLYRRKERERTYNQARLLADGLAGILQKPLLPACLVRLKDTQSQTALNAAERRVNMRDAFAVQNAKWLAGRRLLLVDDVMTTGATVDECALTLKNAGAASVMVATVARGC